MNNIEQKATKEYYDRENTEIRTYDILTSNPYEIMSLSIYFADSLRETLELYKK